jgi:8-oxo-dGTP diphosphatase
MEETLQTACLRELEEETGLRLPAMEQFRVFDAPDRDPRHRTISVVFYALIPEAETARGGDDAAEARWFPVSDLPRLAFDHREIVDLFLSKQGKG